MISPSLAETIKSWNVETRVCRLLGVLPTFSPLCTWLSCQIVVSGMFHTKQTSRGKLGIFLKKVLHVCFHDVHNHLWESVL